jgi:uncharacterized ferritin-like protein (DUF455 family)
VREIIDGFLTVRHDVDRAGDASLGQGAFRDQDFIDVIFDQKNGVVGIGARWFITKFFCLNRTELTTS